MNFADQALSFWIEADSYERAAARRQETLRIIAEKRVDKRLVPAGMTRNDVLARVYDDLLDKDKVRKQNIEGQQHLLRKAHAAAAIATMLGQKPELEEHLNKLKEMS